MQPVDMVKAYVEGELDFAVFQQNVENNPELQRFLEIQSFKPAYVEQENLLLYLFDLKPSAGSNLDARDALSKLLIDLGIDHKTNLASDEDYSLVLQAMPEWVDPEDEYITQLIASIPSSENRPNRLKAMKAVIVKDFCHLKKPPRWLQSAKWPMANDMPMIFVGQLSLGNLLHDDAQVFIFVDHQAVNIRTIVQIA
jgi:hypothetical protein